MCPEMSESERCNSSGYRIMIYTDHINAENPMIIIGMGALSNDNGADMLNHPCNDRVIKVHCDFEVRLK